VVNIKIYLDTCCYNRPFDDGSQESVKKEIAAKQEIQQLVKDRKIDLTFSFVLLDELSRIKLDFKRELILEYIFKNSTDYISDDNYETIMLNSLNIQNTGIKQYDSLHIACAEFAKCDYFITVDKRILKYSSKILKITNPIDFMVKWRLHNGL
jgi:predicted nucleic acid-binding protein